MATVTITGLSSGVTASVSRPSGDTWLTVSISGNKITATVSANTGAQRTSNITVTASDGATATIPVTQYTKSAIIAQPESLYFESAGSTVVPPTFEPTEYPPEIPTEGEMD